MQSPRRCCQHEPIAPAKRQPELEILHCPAPSIWEAWLQDNHAGSPGVWLQIAKRDADAQSVSYAQALELAICFGWIDGQKRALDDRFWLQRFTRRGPRSKWSQINRDTALALIDSGVMRDPGHAQVRAAQADGRWEAAYEPQSRATIPGDFQRELDRNPAAAEFFATLTGARRYAFLYRLHNVRTEAARARRIASYIELLAEHRTLS